MKFRTWLIKFLKDLAARIGTTDIEVQETTFGGADGCDITKERKMTWEITGATEGRVEFLVSPNRYVSMRRRDLMRAIRNCRAMYE